MQKNVEKCREIQKNAEKCRDIERNAEKFREMRRDALHYTSGKIKMIRYILWHFLNTHNNNLNDRPLVNNDIQLHPPSLFVCSTDRIQNPNRENI